MVPAMPEYLWLVVCGALGANDVANAFGTSVGAKTITLRQAVIIAAIFEFGGAMLLGRVVTNTIAGGIADPAVFARQPEVYAYGMVIALAAGFIWQGWASYMGYNVSATHSIIGGIMGFALVYGGGSAVQWATPDPTQFPPYKGVVPIIMSWFFSPVLTGLASALIFSVIRALVMRRKNAADLVFWVLPPAVFITLFINVFFVFTKGAAKTLGNEWPASKSAWVAACVAAGTAVLTAVIVLPLLRIKARKHHERLEAKAAAEAAAKDAAIDVSKLDGASDDLEQQPDYEPTTWMGRMTKKASKAALYGTSVDIHQTVEDDPMIAALHERAEKFDERAEHVFGYLQVFSAICVVFAHGAGEVGYMTGPLSVIYDIYLNGTLSTKLQPQMWCLVISALSLVIGLATYGYNVCRTMGVSMAKLSPSRGFSAELSTALVILVASQLGLPTSSSQCITGGIVGVGLMEGIRTGVNWKLFAQQFASWAATLFVVGLGVAAVFAQGIYSPSKIDGDQVRIYEDNVGNITNAMLSNFNTSLLSAYNGSQAGNLTSLDPVSWAAMNKTVQTFGKPASKIMATKGSSSFIRAADVVDELKAALGLYQNNTIFTLGQNKVLPGAVDLCNDFLGGPTPCFSPQLVPAQ
uniref:Phosphate transporter n=1 Tax=Tetradesmus obliquus TaxID=3088 RepID=A0A383WKG4_TETOB|eukprot:jgi/Sobl393_1/18350/SZX77947.1